MRLPVDIRMRKRWLFGASVALALATLGFAVPAAVAALEANAAPAVPAVRVSDTPNDWGTSLTVRWSPPAPTESAASYEIWRLAAQRGATRGTTPNTAGRLPSEVLASDGWQKVASVASGDTVFTDSKLDSHTAYSYVIVATQASGEVASTPSPAMRPVRQILNRGRINILVAVLAFVLTVVGLVLRARRGAKLFIRKIAGLEAVEEAVGRATEMGRPILYVPGLDPMDEVATVAAIDILGQVAKKAGEYETRLIVPNRDPIVMAVAQQVVRESYSAVGKPNLYREENIFYVTYSQFGFAAAVAGLMIRERPATNFFIGHFYAESLVLAETGNATGAIQIAGTDSDAQLPFFITSCDYTLIGEELYAGAVYLSRQPLLLGALKSQDYAKILLIASMLVGIALSIASPDLAVRFRSLFR